MFPAVASQAPSFEPDVVRDPASKSLSFIMKSQPSEVGTDLIRWLLTQSELAGRTTARVCLHEGPDDEFHQMIIVQYAPLYHRPHKHENKGESLHVIEGEIAFLTFGDDGQVTSVSKLTPENTIIARCASSQWHTVVPLSDRTIYHECKAGRFLGDRDSIFAPWAPAPGTPGAVDYFAQIKQTIAAWS